ncbi:MAG: efflux RND transporter periplasmic adaptor subunit [Bacillota bacterium]|nr:efflux RND transporter periplasmic adaptor subunit [Bacillota bacterium]
MKNGKIIIPLVLIVVIGIGLYYGYPVFFSSDRNPLQATGTIEATTVAVNAKAPGTLNSLSVQEGDPVQKGQLLGELLRNDLIAQRERDTMGVLAAEAKLSDLVSGPRAQELEQAISAVNIARNNKTKADQDLVRSESLFQAGAIAQDALEKISVNAEARASQLEQAQAGLSLLQAGSRSSQIQAATSELDRAKAIVSASEAMLEDLKLYAPQNGVVLSKNYEEGEFLSMGVPVVTIADLEKLWVNVYIPTDDLPAVKLGQAVDVSVSGDNTQYHGIVSHIASQGEFTPKTIQTKQERTNIVFAVKISLDNKDGNLKPGMPADIVWVQGE